MKCMQLFIRRFLLISNLVVLLESLAWPIVRSTYIAKTLKPVRAGGGLPCFLANIPGERFCAEDYDVLVLTGIGAKD